MSADPTIYPVLEHSTRQPDGTWTHSCGSALLGAKVCHPVWDGLFLCSGGGDVQIETVPYCPACGTKPAEAGVPVRGEL
jgi:hypothetical protein